MSGAQNRSVKGIDPKVREAAREAAAKQGMSLSEYLSYALQVHHDGQSAPPRYTQASAPVRRAQRYNTQSFDEHEEDDWTTSAPAPRDPTRLSQRIDAIERRTQLAVTGLDRAVSTMDRSLLGLAARVEDAEALSSESADRIADALDQFRIAGETLSGRLDNAHHDLHTAKERLETQVETAEDVARRAEAAATFLSTELENRDAALGHKLGALEDKTGDALGRALSQARAAAEEAARMAAEASSDAVLELRALHDRLAERLDETQHTTRRAIESAIDETRADHNKLAQRLAGVEFDARSAKESLVEEVVRLESEIGSRIATADQLKSEQQALIARIEKAEAGSREATAGLRQAAGAAIADLRNAQLGLAARVKQVEETAGKSDALDLSEVRAHQWEITERLKALEDKAHAAPMQDALAKFEQRLDAIAERVETPKTDVTTIDQALERLAERLQETESSANTAIRTLEETVSTLSARVEAGSGGDAHAETEALRAMVEQRLDHMAQQTQSEIATQLQAALGGESDGIEGALLDVNRRLAAAERRQAQTIEAISMEIKRMSETVDKRLRTVEGRNDDAAGVTVREELTRMQQSLEKRFDEIERREAAGFDRMGLEVGRLSERLEERVGAVEGRSAQAIEHVGEQVARMAERFNQRHEMLARDLGERMLDSEERAGARVADAIGSIMQRLSEVEEHSTEAVAPVKKAVSSVASRLEALETGKDDTIANPSRRFNDFGDFGDFDAFGAPETSHEYPLPAHTADYAAPAHVSPQAAAQPLRAGPLASAPASAPTPVDLDHDIYFAEDIDTFEDAPASPHQATTPAHIPEPLDLSINDDDVIVEDTFLDDADAFAPPPPEDDDPFWTPEDAPSGAATPLANISTPSHADEPLAPAPAASGSAPAEDAHPTAPASPPNKNDYLNAARKAAQAQAAPKTKKEKEAARKNAEADAYAPPPAIRGSSRVVLWGATGAIAVLVAGSAWYLNQQKSSTHEDLPPAPESAQPQVTNSAEPSDQSGTPAPAPSDPFAQNGVTPAPDALPTPAALTPTPPAPARAAPSVTAPTAPTATAPPATRATTPQPASSVVAGPLPARNVSLEQAARNGDAVAQYELALQRISAGRSGEAVLLLHTAADHGLAMAQYRLAKLYERGEGVPPDLTLARQWTERAAAAGNRRAMHDLGVYFARGEGAPLDEAAAFRWFRQAAELGVADSQFNLGVLYQQGRGVGSSPSEAEFWFLVAARQGDEDAAGRAQTLVSQLQPIQVDQARARAEAFRPRAASAVANGEFGPRPWSTTTVSAAATGPATTPSATTTPPAHTTPHSTSPAHRGASHRARPPG